MDTLRDKIAMIIDSTPFRPKYVSGEGLSGLEKEKHLRARNVAYYKADRIKDALQERLAEAD